MPLSHQTLHFKDLPVGTNFFHPKTNEVYMHTLHNPLWNARATQKTIKPYRTLIHPDTTVELTVSIDFYSLSYSALFAYENVIYIKVARNRARVVNNSDVVKYFEPDDAVSPL